MYPNKVKRILIQNCAPKPTCKNTPRGGIKTDKIIRIKSMTHSLKKISPAKAGLYWACYYSATIVNSSITLRTSSAFSAMLTANCFSASDSTVPFSVTTPMSVSTSMSVPPTSELNK